MADEILPLVSNGTIFTSPPCMAGVPVERVVEDDPYWVATWTSFSGTIQKMKKSLDVTEQEMAGGRGEKLSMQQVHALAGLRDYYGQQGFHPNQILSKQYVLGTGLVDIEILSKLKNIMESLKEARSVAAIIREEPLSWLRGRLAYIIDKNKSKDTLQTLLQSFDYDMVFDSLQNVCDMVLRPPGYVRPKPQKARAKEEEKTSSKEHSSKNKRQSAPKQAKKEEYRRLHQQTFVSAHVNRYLKRQYKAHLKSQRNSIDVQNRAKKEEYRRLHRQTFVPASVNRYLKGRYEAYLESQRNSSESWEEESGGGESDDDGEDGDREEDSDYVG